MKARVVPYVNLLQVHLSTTTITIKLILCEWPHKNMLPSWRLGKTNIYIYIICKNMPAEWHVGWNCQPGLMWMGWGCREQVGKRCQMAASCQHEQWLSQNPQVHLDAPVCMKVDRTPTGTWMRHLPAGTHRDNLLILSETSYWGGLATGTVPEIDGLNTERKYKATSGDAKNCDTLYALARHKYSDASMLA